MVSDIIGELKIFKRSSVSVDEESLNDSNAAREDEKTIPFLRRLRDMLTENENAISFSPGQRQNGKITLGRIIVHDRVTVESKVLPRYFNHSSFASLRRQLNYFSFVRLGKGRQRESTYINEHVVDIDDILHLKRRPAGSTVTAPEEVLVPQETIETCDRITIKDASETPVLSSNIIPIEELSFELSRHRPKRRRLNRKPITESLPTMTLPKMLPQRSFSPVNHFVSEDEHSEGKQFIALDLTKPVPQLTDDDILAGCSALLELSAQRWS